MSSTAELSPRADQRVTIERSARILPVDVPTIQLAGGSVRRMIAGIHLDRRPTIWQGIGSTLVDCARVRARP